MALCPTSKRLAAANVASSRPAPRCVRAQAASGADKVRMPQRPCSCLQLVPGRPPAANDAGPTPATAPTAQASLLPALLAGALTMQTLLVPIDAAFFAPPARADEVSRAAARLAIGWLCRMPRLPQAQQPGRSSSSGAAAGHAGMQCATLAALRRRQRHSSSDLDPRPHRLPLPRCRTRPRRASAPPSAAASCCAPRECARLAAAAQSPPAAGSRRAQRTSGNLSRRRLWLPHTHAVLRLTTCTPTKPPCRREKAEAANNAPAPAASEAAEELQGPKTDLSGASPRQLAARAAARAAPPPSPSPSRMLHRPTSAMLCDFLPVQLLMPLTHLLLPLSIPLFPPGAAKRLKSQAAKTYENATKNRPSLPVTMNEDEVGPFLGSSCLKLKTLKKWIKTGGLVGFVCVVSDV